MPDSFFLRSSGAGAGGGYNAIGAAKKFWGASAILGNTEYTPSTSAIGSGANGWAHSDIRQPFNPAGILLEAKVHEQGPGLIVRGEAQVEVYSASGLSLVGGGLGGSFSISFWGGFQIYDMSITNIQPQGWQITVKGMARGRSGPYNFVDLGDAKELKGKTLAMSLSTWMSDQYGAFSANDQDFQTMANEINALTVDTADGLFVEGNSLADAAEGAILANITDTSFQGFFGFQLGGTAFTDLYAGYQKWGVPGLSEGGKKFGSGDVITCQLFGAPNWANQNDNLLGSYICGWVSMGWIIDTLNSKVLRGRYSMNDSRYSDIRHPSNAKFCGADPIRKMMFRGGSGLGDWIIKGSAFNAGETVYAGAEETVFSYDWFTALGSNIRNFYFSHYALRRICDEFNKANTQPTEDTKYEDLALGAMPLGRFMEKLFDMIRTATGGAVDLTLDHNKDSKTTFYIASRKVGKGSVGASTIPLSARNESNYGIRDVKVSANTPKAVAARMFANVPEVSGLGKIHSGGKSVTIPDYTAADIAKAFGEAAGINDSASDTVHQTNMALGLDSVQSKSATVDPAALPSEISATVDLNTGLGFGQAVRISPSPALLGGSRVLWSICDVVHRVSGTDGTSEFRAVGRLTQ